MADRVSTYLNFILQSYLVFPLSRFPFAAPPATLTQGQSLQNWETLTSPEDVFEFGFFSRDPSDSYYLGIWYRKRIPAIISTDIAFTTYDGQPVVWVGNREDPIRDTIETGLRWISSSRSAPFLLHAGNAPTEVTLTLLDSGNLLLREVSRDSRRALWESFEPPTAVLLPAMRLRANKTLTSWISVQVPARGAFSSGIDPCSAKQLIIWDRGENTGGHCKNRGRYGSPSSRKGREAWYW